MKTIFLVLLLFFNCYYIFGYWIPDQYAMDWGNNSTAGAYDCGDSPLYSLQDELTIEVSYLYNPILERFRIVII